MKTIDNGANELVILDANELRDSEKRAAMAAKLDAGDTIVAGAFSLHKPVGASRVSMTVAGEAYLWEKSSKEILQAIAEYKTADRVVAILSV